MSIVKGNFASLCKTIQKHYRLLMSETNEIKTDNLDPAQVILRALHHTDFEHHDIGGLLFSLLKSLHSDFIDAGTEFSETTESYAQDLLNMLADDSENYRSHEDLLDEDEDDTLDKYRENDSESEEDDEDDENSAILNREEDDGEEVSA